MKGPGRTFEFTTQQLAEIREMRRLGNPWVHVANRFGHSIDMIRRRCDPEWRERRTAQINSARKKETSGRITPMDVIGQHTSGPDGSTAIYNPRRDGDLMLRDLTAVILGDPPIGRSALDHRNGQHIGG